MGGDRGGVGGLACSLNGKVERLCTSGRSMLVVLPTLDGKRLIQGGSGRPRSSCFNRSPALKSEVGSNGLSMDIRPGNLLSGFGADIFRGFCFSACSCCSSRSSDSGRSPHLPQTGTSSTSIRCLCGSPCLLRYDGVFKGVRYASDGGLIQSPWRTYRTNKTRETAPMPLAPAKAYRVSLPVHDLAASPAYTDVVCPLPAVSADDSSLWTEDTRW